MYREELISIVLVNYNGKKWLEKCLDSLFSQTLQYFEIIFVDNSSSDESLEVLKNYDLGKIQIIKSERNLGFAGGNNLGIENSRGNLILLLNTDTWVDPDFLQKMLEFYHSHSFDVIAPTEVNYDSSVNKTLGNNYISKIDPFGYNIFLKNVNSISRDHNFFLSGACLFFEKGLYKRTQGLDSDFFMYFEDVDWFWRMNLMNIKFGYANDIVLHHAFAGSVNSSRNISHNVFLWRNQNCLQMLLKNYHFVNLLWVLPLYFLQNLFELIFFFIILKPHISYTYIQGWIFNLRNIKRTLKKRKWVQENRILSDNVILSKMYFGSAKLYYLFNFIKNGKSI